jgi:hypothetical protein
MKMNINFAFILVLLTLNSCTIKGSFRGLYSFYAQTKASRPELLSRPAPDSSICEIKNTDTPKVYVINGSVLKECLKSRDKAIVYIWSSRCQSELCYSLNLVQQKCDAKGLELFIVAEYYDDELMNFKYRIEHPILGIDTEYYKTNFTSRYLSRFLRDLAGITKFENRFFYFENGIMKRSFSEIDKIS